MKYLSKILSIIVALSLAACASVQQYEGSERPKDQVATITKDSLRIHYRLVNGRTQGMYGNTVQVPPGPTTLVVGYQIANLASTSSLVVSFNAVAGKDYVLDYWRKEMTWGVYLIDKSVDKIIAKGISDAVLSSDAVRDAELKEFKEPARTGGVYIYRNEAMGGQNKIAISLDHEHLGDTQHNTYLYAEVTPGKHTIACSSENEDAIDIEAAPGKLYFVWQEVKFGISKNRCKLHLVESKKGQAGVVESKLAISTKD